MWRHAFPYAFCDQKLSLLSPMMLNFPFRRVDVCMGRDLNNHRIFFCVYRSLQMFFLDLARKNRGRPEKRCPLILPVF